jgi:hypothetical protein
MTPDIKKKQVLLPTRSDSLGRVSRLRTHQARYQRDTQGSQLLQRVRACAKMAERHPFPENGT